MNSRPEKPKNSLLFTLNAHWLQFHFRSWMKYSGWKQTCGGIWII